MGLGYKDGGKNACRIELISARGRKESEELAETAFPVMKDLFHALETIGESYAVLLFDMTGLVCRILGHGEVPLKEGSRCNWVMSALGDSAPGWKPFHFSQVSKDKKEGIEGWDITGHPILHDGTLYGALCIMTHSVNTAWNKRMDEFFTLFEKHSDIVTRVTAWGVSDGDSWKNDFPVRGRKDYPLLFDRNYQPKDFIRKMIEEKDNN